MQVTQKEVTHFFVPLGQSTVKSEIFLLSNIPASERLKWQDTVWCIYSHL